MDMEMMASSFYFGSELENFLFYGLNTKSWQGILGICTVLAALALVYEGLHLLKLFFLNRFIAARKAHHRKESINPQPFSSSSSRPFLPNNGSGEPAPRSLLEESDHHNNGDGTITSVSTRRKSGSSLDFLELGLASALHSLYMVLGFTLMNAVMTFNAWMLIAISIGVALGYFCFGNYRREENLIQPLETETTSLNDDDEDNDSLTTQQPQPPPADGGGDRCVPTTNQTKQSPSRTPVLYRRGKSAGGGDEGEENPGESSKLIVAEVHPRILSTSTTST